MDKKEKLIVKLRKENKQLKQEIKSSDYWLEYWREKVDNFRDGKNIFKRECIYWKCLFFSSLVGSFSVILLSVL